MRRIGRDDFAKTSPMFGEGEVDPEELWGRPIWRVYERYELVEGADGGSPYFEARGEMVDAYEPLSDKPYLCLEFARTAERKDPDEALEQWIARYGLLGLAYTPVELPHLEGNPYVEVYAPSSHTMPEVAFPPGTYRDFGGTGETLKAVREEARVANEVLMLYEATLSKAADALEKVLFGFHGGVGRARTGFFVQAVEHAYGASRVEALAHVALERAAALVQERLRLFAYPGLSPRKDREREVLAVGGLVADWSPRNLLGAMYLQFFWLMMAGGNLSRCRDCKRIISYAAPLSEGGTKKGRKPRSDKVFCDDRCRQRTFYHTKKKHRKQSQ